jgi:hypothetical protein
MRDGGDEAHRQAEPKILARQLSKRETEDEEPEESQPVEDEMGVSAQAPGREKELQKPDRIQKAPKIRLCNESFLDVESRERIPRFKMHDQEVDQKADERGGCKG